jgi:hypothetical protein
VAGSSWSLTRGQLNRARTVGPVIAINSTIFAAPWAAAVYAWDSPWWAVNLTKVMDAAPEAIRATMSQTAASEHEVGLVDIGEAKLPGSSSGHQAVLWAAMMGFEHICCIGMDMAFAPDGQRHFHAGHHQDCRTHSFPAEKWRADFSALCLRLRERGVHVAQCSPGWQPMPGARGMTQERWLQQVRGPRHVPPCI